MAPATVLDLEALDVDTTDSAAVSVTWEPESKKKGVFTFTIPKSVPCDGSSPLFGSATAVFFSTACATYKFTVAGAGCSHAPSPRLTLARRRGFEKPYENTTLLIAESAADGDLGDPTSARCDAPASGMEPITGYDSLEIEVALICGDRIKITAGVLAIVCDEVAATVTIELVEAP